jgi:hypothetical protein
VTSTARRDLRPSPCVAIFTIDVKPDRREDFLAAMDKAMAESAKQCWKIFGEMYGSR